MITDPQESARKAVFFAKLSIGFAVLAILCQIIAFYLRHR